MSRKSSNKSWMWRLPLSVGLVAAALSVSALAQSVPFPTYTGRREPERVAGPGLPFNLYHSMGRQ
jgi:hypothetical protein